LPTMVNDSVVPPGEEWPLHAGDHIAFGSLAFMIQYREKPLSQRDLEEWAARCLDVNHAQDLYDDEADEFDDVHSASQAAQQIIVALTRQKGLVIGRLRIGLESGVTTVRFTDTKLLDEGEIAYIRRELCDQLNRP